MLRYGGKSRRQLFDEFDRPSLKPLPQTRFEFGEWKWAKVHIDYHVELEKHRHSVPCRHVGKKVEIRFNATSVEILLSGERIASHVRSYRVGGFTTLEGHISEAHRGHAKWTSERTLNWGSLVPLRGQPNEPGHVRFTAMKLAELKGMAADELAETCARNSARLLNLKVRWS